ncbi:MAG: GntR family transcriptional regulator [Granulosicoccus sp.]|nr:GntR family transcriptional regulator [Granulosicoccus sp.]
MNQLHSIEALERKSLHEELVERLRDILIEGDFNAGDKVPEKALCEQLGVSRTPMREALKVIAADGLITLIPNRGAVFRDITAEEIDALFPVIGALEALAGELACQHFSDQEIVAIKKLHEKMRHAYDKRNLSSYFKLNQQIHERIMAAANNAVLSEQYRMLSNRLRRARYQANMSDQRWADAIAEHDEMMHAIEKRDGAALAQILRAHLQSKHQSIAAQLQH